jgi:gamma-tubulin complex component 2
VLTLLHDRITSLSGDTNTQKILLHLTQLAAVPYMQILQLWILKGVIWDPQHEFLVEDTKLERESQICTDDYWEKRYIICVDKVPRFLDTLADIILRTGKYLNVIRECGKNIMHTQTETLKFSHTDNNYVQFINNAYNFASESLLQLFMNENDLIGRLLSVKRYFLLQQGDFIIQFMDACEQELGKKVDEVLPMRLENLLELTLRLSSAKHDKYQDDLRTMLLPYGIVTQMSKIINKEDGK